MHGIDRFHWNLTRTFFGICCLFAVLGIICNSLLFLTSCSIFVQLPLLFDVSLEMDIDDCIRAMFLPEMGIAIGCTGILCIGLDRMFAVLFTLRYRAMNNKCYYFISASVRLRSSCRSEHVTDAITMFSPVICEVMTAYPDDGQVWFTNGNVLVNMMSVIVYFTTWIGLRFQSGSSLCTNYKNMIFVSDSIMMKRVIKSLFIIAAVDLSGWFLTPGLIHIALKLQFTPHQLYAGIYFASIFINMSLALKLFIYFSTRS
ncbi:hypothetical protein PENTCL1PPCAC_14758 [Pristionchus entomophagus]|uniref:G protein-coupled receptor n=1 Tax=Pristionchus entomophagus TaxID=358040 RepID=A0AAV5TBK1_9BILA|nr:hypothetical protein PENTCL1PPCAC_14758 [Pristionchus entomophagus]